jgi:Rieske Fe-S protein
VEIEFTTMPLERTPYCTFRESHSFRIAKMLLRATNTGSHMKYSAIIGVSKKAANQSPNPMKTAPIAADTPSMQTVQRANAFIDSSSVFGSMMT